MRQNDVTCPECGAGFRRLELVSLKPCRGEYHCPACDQVLEQFDGSAFVTYRLTVQPSVRDIRGEFAAASLSQ